MTRRPVKKMVKKRARKRRLRPLMMQMGKGVATAC